MSPTSTPLVNTRVAIIMGTAMSQRLEFIYQPLVGIFEHRGYQVSVYSIPGLGLGSLESSTKELDKIIFSNNKYHYILLGHSQGGVHALGLAAKHPKRVEAVFTFGTPHHGTMLASLGSWLDWVPSIKEMRAHSTHLHNLRELKYSQERIHSLFTVFDQLVVPWFASTVHGSKNVILMPKSLHKLLRGIGLRADDEAELIHGYAEHLFIIWHKKFHSYILSTLDSIEFSQLEIAS